MDAVEELLNFPDLSLLTISRYKDRVNKLLEVLSLRLNLLSLFVVADRNHLKNLFLRHGAEFGEPKLDLPHNFAERFRLLRLELLPESVCWLCKRNS